MIALVAAIIVAFVYTGPVVAKPGKKGSGAPHGSRNGHHRRVARGHNKFQLEGVVKNVVVAPDAQTAGTLTVTVKSGTRTIKQFRTKDLTMTVASDARIVQDMADGSRVAITLDKVVVGVRVHVGGKIDRTDPANLVYVARKVIVHAVEQTTSP